MTSWALCSGRTEHVAILSTGILTQGRKIEGNISGLKNKQECRNIPLIQSKKNSQIYQGDKNILGQTHQNNLVVIPEFFRP